jgi:hypothetical protein
MVEEHSMEDMKLLVVVVVVVKATAVVVGEIVDNRSTCHTVGLRPC